MSAWNVTQRTPEPESLWPRGRLGEQRPGWAQKSAAWAPSSRSFLPRWSRRAGSPGTRGVTDRKDKSIARSVGQFFGHLWKGVTSEPNTQRQVLRKDIEEEQKDTEHGAVTLRRTTIEEVEVRREEQDR